jgi:SAM-dependent methyltransferase
MTYQVINLYDSKYKAYDKWYEDHEPAYLSEIEALKRVLPQRGKGLEIGVGTGRFAAPLGIPFGLDPSKKMISLAKRRGVSVLLGFGENLPFVDGCLDYAAVINTLCFVKNPLKTLKESHRVLKNKGQLIVGFIDRNSFLGRTYKAKKSSFYAYAKFFTAEELAELTKSLGFCRLSFYQTVFQFPEKLRTVEVPKKGYGTGGFVVISAEKK